MTDKKGIYWKRQQGTYLQPDVIESPAMQNANNARHAIWALGRMVEMEVYPSAQGWRASDEDPVDDGRHDRGEPTVVKVRAVIQPRSGDQNGSSELFDLPEGQYTHGEVVIHLDSHDPINLCAADDHPELFPNGVRVLGPDTEGTDGQKNFATVFRFRNRRWKVTRMLELFEGGDEELSCEGATYRMLAEEFKDRSHERNATPETAAAPYWGPE